MNVNYTTNEIRLDVGESISVLLPGGGEIYVFSDGRVEETGTGEDEDE